MSKVGDLLIKRGYGHHMPYPGDPDYVEAYYYRVAYGSGVPNCLLNEKPPQFSVREGSLDGRLGYELGICNEAPEGWIDFKFYSLGEEDLVTRLDDMETALLKAWNVLFELEQASVSSVANQ